MKGGGRTRGIVVVERLGVVGGECMEISRRDAIRVSA
jgi:hypothetical protein